MMNRIGDITLPNNQPPEWVKLPEEVKADLLDWFDVSNPEAEDLARLAELYASGRFRAWNCPSCDERVYEGNPESWEHFQGVCQLDYTSYPGDAEKFTAKYLAKLCDLCRCYGSG